MPEPFGFSVVANAQFTYFAFVIFLKACSSKLLYRWKGGKWVGKPAAKKLAKTIVEMRLQKKSGVAIAKELKISRKVVWTVLKDRRITGTDEFESLVDIGLWEAAQKVHVPTYQELEKRSRERKQQIMTHVPAYRWEI